ncbi:MAG: type II toxin-antitoxin system VapC family toxin [Acidobacteriaceae bacterium]|nr:type II toxin-antitoxin system VapC family toxin [Acidobacteriaceae bacterium]MBV9294737.1 type II toxin-antitoxin system VapC family toxin [Acidobacteriaceae bacterium]MBV9763317.1 type II toxin-antitoxin system VapC family toxin [Acidobacteriaceae bacterium]
MTAVFADTFYWAALTAIDDPAHTRAMELSRSLAPDRIMTTDEVLAEYLTFFPTASAKIRDRVGRNVDTLINSFEVRIVPQSRESFLAGLKVYRARPAKGYSLTDCISMITMKGEGLTDVLTNDRHFEQEGFRMLFR